MLHEFVVGVIVFRLEEVVRHVTFCWLWRNILLMFGPCEIRRLTIARRLLCIPRRVGAHLVALVQRPLDAEALAFAYVANGLLLLEKRLRPLLRRHCLASVLLDFLCRIIVKKCHLILRAVFGRIFYSHGLILDLGHFVSPFDRRQDLLVVLVHLLLQVVLRLIRRFQIILI